MPKSISSLQDLREERRRLRLGMEVHKAEVQRNFKLFTHLDTAGALVANFFSNTLVSNDLVGAPTTGAQATSEGLSETFDDPGMVSLNEQSKTQLILDYLPLIVQFVMVSIGMYKESAADRKVNPEAPGFEETPKDRMTLLVEYIPVIVEQITNAVAAMRGLDPDDPLKHEYESGFETKVSPAGYDVHAAGTAVATPATGVPAHATLETVRLPEQKGESE